MKKNLMITTAVLSLFGTVVGAADLGSASYGAGLNLLSPTATGFAYGSSVDTTGLGSGAASVTLATPATFDMTGYASSTSDLTNSVANSGVVSVVNFDRTVAASGSSIGLGQVVAQGDAKSSIGAVGSAFGLTVNNTIATTTASGGGTTATTSSADSSSAASLIGTGSTTVVAGLLGKASNFVGSTGTTVTSNQTGVAYSAMNAVGDDGGTGITIAPMTSSVVYKGMVYDSTGAPVAGSASNYNTYAEALAAANALKTGTDTVGVEAFGSSPDMSTVSGISTALANLAAGQGTAGFTNTFDLGANGIDLAVSNVGGGAISLAADTSGFFSGGSATSGATTFGSVFTAP
jgi:trimeric autotransporter adhesin